MRRTSLCTRRRPDPGRRNAATSPTRAGLDLGADPAPRAGPLPPAGSTVTTSPSRIQGDMLPPRATNRAEAPSAATSATRSAISAPSRSTLASGETPSIVLMESGIIAAGSYTFPS